MILINSNGTNETLKPSEFTNELELEDIICNNPQLLCTDGGSELYFLKRQVTTLAGVSDAIMVSADGLLVVVEVKLARNPEVRRTVVGQLIDYVATLTEYTVDELNELLDGCLENILSEKFEDETEYKRVWQAIGANLRAGVARYILVVDSANTDLERIVKFLALKSSLDIRLITINKYVSESGFSIFVPQNLIEENNSELFNREKSLNKETSPKLLSVISEYLSLPNCNHIHGSARSYRQVKITGWPPALHYEFISKSNTVSVELHIETDKVAALGRIIKDWKTSNFEDLNGSFIWDQKWSKGKGRLIYKSLDSNEPKDIALAMAKFIKYTKPLIDDVLKKNQQIS